MSNDTPPQDRRTDSVRHQLRPELSVRNHLRKGRTLTSPMMKTASSGTRGSTKRAQEEGTSTTFDQKDGTP